MAHEPLLPLTPAEQALVDEFNTDPAWTRERLIAQLKAHLQVAAEVELATIPIYLYTYYSIERTQEGSMAGRTVTNYDPLSVYANKAGGLIMSVAVEEMLHMSLACNLLFAIGGEPQLYGKSPGPYPTNLPGHQVLGPDGEPLALPLAPFSYEHLWDFLEIEYPARPDAPPQGSNWTTIGQIYAYIRCIVACTKLTDADFQQGDARHQLQSDYYAPSNIDAIYPRGNFNPSQPPSGPGSAARHADYGNWEDSHAGRKQLVTVRCRHSALVAIATICDQGEGFNHTRFDDPSQHEMSHYYKFLTLQSELKGFPEGDRLPALPPPPRPADEQFDDLSAVVVPFPTNPTTAGYPERYQDLSNFCNGLYQYMLICTETTFRLAGTEQKQFFNRAMHLSMIWMLDKLAQVMRTFELGDGQVLAPTFENYDLGARYEAYGNLVGLAGKIQTDHPDQYARVGYILNYISNGSLPDVSAYWNPFTAVPEFPKNPPEDGALPEGAARHACMGLNACKGQDRFGTKGHPVPGTQDTYAQNACKGQGYCSTALDSTLAAKDHTCHVLNGCKDQGGCGLYGTAEEQNHPGANDCRYQGSCATPINAERFSTDGPNRGKSVWQRAREVFAAREGIAPAELPDPPGDGLFAHGPTYAWISSSSCMTACGSSGMSGAGSCS